MWYSPFLSSQGFWELTSHKPLHKTHPLQGLLQGWATWYDPEVHVVRQPLSLRRQPNDQERFRGFRTPCPRHTEILLASPTYRNSHVYYSPLVLTKTVRRTRKNGKASWGRRRQICGFLMSLVFARRPWREAHPSVTWHLLVHWERRKEHRSAT